MSFISIPFDVIKARHPDAAARLEKAIRASKIQQAYPEDASAWSWGYDHWQQAQALTFSDVLANIQSPTTYKNNWHETKGRERLECVAADLTISLQATTGRRHKSEILDNTMLLAGPDECLPREVLGYHPKPPGPSVWVWTSQPGKAVCDWRDYVAVGAARKDNVLCILLRDGDYNRVFVIQKEDGSFERVSNWPGSAKDVRAIHKAITQQKPSAAIGSDGVPFISVSVEDPAAIAWPIGPYGPALTLAQSPSPIRTDIVYRNWDGEICTPAPHTSQRKASAKP